MPWHARSVEQTLEELGSGRDGLSTVEALRRLDEFGPNELRKEGDKSPLLIFLHQFKEFLMVLLLIATGISVIVGEFLDAAVIMFIVVVSAFLGFVQEFRASRALDALKRMSAPVASVVRDGEEQKVPAREVVPGDIVLLATGDRAPADGRLIEEYNLKVDQSAFTGESEAVEKDVREIPAETPLADMTNVVFAGTTVIYGRGVAVTFATGMRTEFGKIAHLVQAAEDEHTPLESRMGEIGRKLGLGSLAIVVLVVGLGLLRGEHLLAMFLWGLSLAVAAVPEALPAVVTGALTIGVQRMARRHAIIRKLPAVETLGSTTIICSDKTGTLTKNEMTVRRIWMGEQVISVTGVGYEPIGEFRLNDQSAVKDGGLALLSRIAVLCNDAHLLRDEKGRHHVVGDPTEGALLVMAAKAGHEPEPARIDYPRTGEIPFSSARKRMTTVHRTPADSVLVCMKGAPEVVLQHCTHYWLGGQALFLSDEVRRRILAENEDMASRALRVLGFAYRELPSPHLELTEENVERRLTFVALVGKVDPPREEARAALLRAEDAGIRSVMITGDHKLTAVAVARELGLLKEDDLTLTGTELDGLRDEEFIKQVGDIAVYARVSPEHKLRIVQTLQHTGHVAAMTGDGINDAPALRSAAIGVAMGITGTDVTKEAADMVLADDNFATIVAAVEEGRAIYDNVKKYLAYLLSSNVGEILIVLVAGLVGLPLPLLTTQILWVNLVTDGLPALALGIDPPDPDIMRRPPRPAGESVFTPGVTMLIGLVALLMAAGTLPVFVWKLQATGDVVEARTMAFTLLVMFEMFNAFNCRSEKHSIFAVGPFRNRWLLLAVVSSILLQMAVLYIPFLQDIFRVTALGPDDWLVLILVSSTALIGGEIGKRVLRSTLVPSPTGKNG
ncbi:MAG: calcium-translocating P-type ATPase, SERCA-type [Chloroflexi bacterium]|nr:calcium-translocating P-type ATPase, SERCA-type [Chloroflexota bacterium]